MIGTAALSLIIGVLCSALLAYASPTSQSGSVSKRKGAIFEDLSDIGSSRCQRQLGFKCCLTESDSKLLRVGPGPASPAGLGA